MIAQRVLIERVRDEKNIGIDSVLSSRLLLGLLSAMATSCHVRKPSIPREWYKSRDCIGDMPMVTFSHTEDILE